MKQENRCSALFIDVEWKCVHRKVERKKMLKSSNIKYYQSQWPRGIRHEMSSPAQTLGSWVRIPLKAWMFVWVYSVFVLSCVGSGLAKNSSPIQGVLPTV
jgi:hypothetical protein